MSPSACINAPASTQTYTPKHTHARAHTRTHAGTYTHLEVRGQKVYIHEERHKHDDAQGVGERSPPQGPNSVDIAARPQEGGRHRDVVGGCRRVKVGREGDRQGQQGQVADVRVAIHLCGHISARLSGKKGMKADRVRLQTHVLR